MCFGLLSVLQTEAILLPKQPFAALALKLLVYTVVQTWQNGRARALRALVLP